MKHLSLAMLLVLTAWSGPAQAAVFACLAPGGAVICHVSDPAGNATHQCNAQCPACKNGCTAKKLVSEGSVSRGSWQLAPDADMTPNSITPGADNRETARQIIEDGLVQTPK